MNKTTHTQKIELLKQAGWTEVEHNDQLKVSWRLNFQSLFKKVSMVKPNPTLADLDTIDTVLKSVRYSLEISMPGEYTVSGRKADILPYLQDYDKLRAFKAAGWVKGIDKKEEENYFGVWWSRQIKHTGNFQESTHPQEWFKFSPRVEDIEFAEKQLDDIESKVFNLRLPGENMVVADKELMTGDRRDIKDVLKEFITKIEKEKQKLDLVDEDASGSSENIDIDLI